MAARLRRVWLSGWRDGKFIRPAADRRHRFGCVLMTAACSSSASSTSRSMPAGGAGGAIGDEHRAVGARPAAARASTTAPESACGGAASVSFGIRSAPCVGDRPLLQLAVGDEHDRPVRRRHRDLVRAHRRLGEMLQRQRRVVPFRVVADHRRGVLHAVDPFDARAPHRRIERVAEHHVDRHAIAPRVVDRHRRVLQADRAVRHHRRTVPCDRRRQRAPGAPHRRPSRRAAGAAADARHARRRQIRAPSPKRRSSSSRPTLRS